MSRFFYDERREIAIEFGGNLDELMKAAGMSRKQLAARSGVSKSSIDNYMVGRCEPTAFAIVKLAQAIGCSTDRLLGLGACRWAR